MVMQTTEVFSLHIPSWHPNECPGFWATFDGSSFARCVFMCRGYAGYTPAKLPPSKVGTYDSNQRKMKGPGNLRPST